MGRLGGKFGIRGLGASMGGGGGITPPSGGRLRAKFTGVGDLDSQISQILSISATFDGEGDLTSDVSTISSVTATFDGEGDLVSTVSAGFNPSDYVEIAYDAENATVSSGKITDIGNVGSTGSTYDVGQTTDANRFSINTSDSAYNNMDTIDMDASASEFMDIDNSYAINLDVGYSSFFVGNMGALSTFLFTLGDGSVSYLQGFARTSMRVFVRGNTTSVQIECSPTDMTTPRIWYLYGVGNDKYAYVGETGDEYTASAACGTDTAIYLGRTGSVYSTGTLAHLAVKRSIMSEDDVNAYGDYLSDRFGLTWTEFSY